MKYIFLKDKCRRILYFYYERKKKFLISIFQDLSLPAEFRFFAYKTLIKIPRNASITRFRNRCVLTNRSRSIYWKFGLSRLMFRKYLCQGKLIGIQKSSW